MTVCFLDQSTNRYMIGISERRILSTYLFLYNFKLFLFLESENNRINVAFSLENNSIHLLQPLSWSTVLKYSSNELTSDRYRFVGQQWSDVDAKHISKLNSCSKLKTKQNKTTKQHTKASLKSKNNFFFWVCFFMSPQRHMTKRAWHIDNDIKGFFFAANGKTLSGFWKIILQREEKTWAEERIIQIWIITCWSVWRIYFSLSKFK